MNLTFEPIRIRFVPENAVHKIIQDAHENAARAIETPEAQRARLRGTATIYDTLPSDCEPTVDTLADSLALEATRHIVHATDLLAEANKIVDARAQRQSADETKAWQAQAQSDHEAPYIGLKPADIYGLAGWGLGDRYEAEVAQGGDGDDDDFAVYEDDARPGDVVELLSGGYPMTVVDVAYEGADQFVTCIWHDEKGHTLRALYPSKALLLVERWSRD